MQGHLDSDLSELGVKQANWLAKRLEDVTFGAVYSSPLGRAYKTADIIGESKGLKVIKDNRLAEINLGIWQGKSMEEIIALDPINYDYFWNRPDLYINDSGETFTQVMGRVEQFFYEVANKHIDENIMLVAHAAVLRCLFSVLFHDRDIENLWKNEKLMPTSLTILDYKDGKVSVEMMADTSHYEEESESVGWFSDIKS